MESIFIFLRFAKCRYIAYRILLRLKMGKKKRDEFLRNIGVSIPNFLPERPYSLNGIKAIPRKYTDDFYFLFTSKETELEPHLIFNENETFVDVGANVGTHTLKIANTYKAKGVSVIAIEAHPETYAALCRNVELNNFKAVKTINKAVSDKKGFVTMYERIISYERFGRKNHIRSTLSTIVDTADMLYEKSSLRVECDTLDNILSNSKVDVMKMDIEGAEVLALNGATTTLKRLRKIIIEVHQGNFEKVKQTLETFKFELEITHCKGSAMEYIIGSKLAKIK
jgi:FkbM family methyltransferase